MKYGQIVPRGNYCMEDNGLFYELTSLLPDWEVTMSQDINRCAINIRLRYGDYQYNSVVTHLRLMRMSCKEVAIYLARDVIHDMTRKCAEQASTEFEGNDYLTLDILEAAFKQVTGPKKFGSYYNMIKRKE